jgi:hypothetical protein
LTRSEIIRGVALMEIQPTSNGPYLPEHGPKVNL